MKFLRTKNVRQREIKNSEIIWYLNVKDTKESLEDMRISWYGHDKGTEEASLPKEQKNEGWEEGDEESDQEQDDKIKLRGERKGKDTTGNK